MKSKLRILCVALVLAVLFAACTDPADPVADPTSAPATKEPEITEIVGTVDVATPSPESAEAVTPESTEAPTSETQADATPAAVGKTGVITTNFPDYDTGTDADYSYQSDDLRIAIKVVHTTIRDNMNRDLKETYYIADIWIRSIHSFRTQFARGEFATGSEEGDVLAKRENAIFAVNGSYNQGLSMRAGTQYRGLRQNKGWNSCAACFIYRDGTMKTFKLGEESFNVKTEIEKGAVHGWQFGPVIIRNSEIDPQATKYSLGFKARNMLGYYEPGHYVIVTCDCRGDDAQGMDATMMANLMKSLNVKEAFNLDGGTSAVMVFMGQVINHPTLRNDDGTMVEGRPIVDMLLFGEYDENGVSADLSTFTADKFAGK